MFSLFKWTKIEVTFVSCLICIIVGISYYQIRIGEMKSRDAQRRSDTELVARGLTAYFKQNGQYPNEIEGMILSCGSRGTEACVWGDSQLVDADNVSYVRNMPRDPFAVEGYSYIYEVREDRKKFKIYARLEYEYDPVVKSNLTVGCGNGLQCNWYAE